MRLCFKKPVCVLHDLLLFNVCCTCVCCFTCVCVVYMIGCVCCLCVVVHVSVVYMICVLFCGLCLHEFACLYEFVLFVCV